jgi:hypothetical protein
VLVGYARTSGVRPSVARRSSARSCGEVGKDFQSDLGLGFVERSTP